MRHLGYVAMLVFCLAATIPLVPLLRLRRIHRAGRLVVAVVASALPFALWDVAAIRAGQWSFDPTQIVDVRVFGLPVEELGFFIVVPFAAIVTYEGVGAVLRRLRRGAASRR